MSEPKVSSLAKALHVSERFSVNEPELGITEIATKLGIGKSNAHNIISTYCQLGYLQQMPNRKYALGFKLLERRTTLSLRKCLRFRRCRRSFRRTAVRRLSSMCTAIPAASSVSCARKKNKRIK